MIAQGTPLCDWCGDRPPGDPPLPVAHGAGTTVLACMVCRERHGLEPLPPRKVSASELATLALCAELTLPQMYEAFAACGINLDDPDRQDTTRCTVIALQRLITSTDRFHSSVSSEARTLINRLHREQGVPL